MTYAVLVFPGIDRERDMACTLKLLGVDGIASVRQGTSIENYRVEVLG
jgi:phosphoribosylformylglycinamidine (FGAM) synthase-like amidotransferase family enzyme